MSIAVHPAFPIQGRLFLATFCFTTATFFCLVAPGFSHAQAEQTAPANPLIDSQKRDLAHRYLEARRDLTKIMALAIKPQDVPDQAGIDKIVLQMMPALSQSKQWSPQYKNWERVKGILHDSVTHMFDQIIADQKNLPRQKQLDDAFEAGFVSNMSDADLQKIVDFYESPTGSKFVGMHSQLFKFYPEAVAKVVNEVQAGKGPSQDTAQDDPRFKTVLGLFYEYALYQEIVLDPGPGKDRSGLPAIRMSLEMAVRKDLPTFDAIWNTLGPEERQQVVSYRQSSAWEVERVALVRGMQASVKIAQPAEYAKKISASLVQAIAKVQALLPP